MKHVCAILLVFGSLVASATPALADTIVFEATVVLDLRTGLGAPVLGPDTLGLDGATIVYRSEFEASDTYFERFSDPTLDAIADSLTITGSSVSAVNGTYSAIDGIAFYPTFRGQQLGGGPGGQFASWSVNGSFLNMRNFVTAISGVSVGDNVALSHFSTTLDIDQFNLEEFYVGSVKYDGRDSLYYLSSFSAKVTAVPEPSTLALFGVGAIAVIWRRRRRS